MHKGPTVVKLRSGRSMPMIGLGTYLQSPEQAQTAVLCALQLGYRAIDTAEFYANHVGIGNAIKESGVPRSEIFITDKISPGGGGAPVKTADEVIAIVKTNMNLLQVSFLDQILIHHAFAGKDARVAHYRALLELKHQGIVGEVGVSNFSELHIAEIEAAGLELPSTNQIEVHPLCTQRQLRQYLKTKGIVAVAYSSLAPISTWRAQPGQASSKTGADTELVKAKIKAIAERLGISHAKLMLSWAVQQGIPILPKSDSSERIADNFDLGSTVIPEEDMETLDSLDANRCFAWPIGNPLSAP